MFVPPQLRKKKQDREGSQGKGDAIDPKDSDSGPKGKEKGNGDPKEPVPHRESRAEQGKENASDSKGNEDGENASPEPHRESQAEQGKENASHSKENASSSKRKRELSAQSWSTLRKPPARSSSTVRNSPASSSSTARDPSGPSPSTVPIRTPSGPSSSAVRIPSGPSSSTVPRAPSSTVPSDPRDLTMSDMLADSFVQLGRYSYRDDMWHGSCFLYWFGSGVYPRFTHTLSMNLVADDNIYRHDCGRRFLARIAAHIGGSFDDVAWMTGHAYPSTIAVMFRHAADAQYVLATAWIPGVGSRRWNNPAMNRRKRGFTVEFDSRLELRGAYDVAALSGEIADIRVKVERTEQIRRGETRYIVRYRAAASRIHAFQNPRDGMSNLRAFDLDGKAINVTGDPTGDQPDVTGVNDHREDDNSTVHAAVTLFDNRVVGTPLDDSPYRPWSVYDWLIVNVAEAWSRARTLQEHGDVNITAYRYARSRTFERVSSLRHPAVLEYDRYLAMKDIDRVQYDNEHHRYR